MVTSTEHALHHQCYPHSVEETKVFGNTVFLEKKGGGGERIVNKKTLVRDTSRVRKTKWWLQVALHTVHHDIIKPPPLCRSTWKHSPSQLMPLICPILSSP